MQRRHFLPIQDNEIRKLTGRVQDLERDIDKLKFEKEAVEKVKF